MITKNNFKKVLEIFEFETKDNIYSKKINGEIIQADFISEKLIYPRGVKIEGEFTTNFTSLENFVVFECVHRLLLLGYKPEHLTLEPKWKLGHGASGGRADIVINDNDKKVFAIIECKTAGKEFEDASSIGKQYPSQLFSYAQQEGSTQLICLYTSDLENDKLVPSYYVIPLADNENLLNTLQEEGKEISTYKNSNRYDELFDVWKNTYHQEAFTTGFLEEGNLPFQLGKKNYSISDLKDLSHADIQKKYHQFATILRKYNVSGRENAFDKLVNLFLCKVVDEKENPANLKFYWRGMAYDTHFDLQDRLQLLYQQGMKQFLNEDVTYINQEKIDEAFKFLKDDPDATKETINYYFKQLKFFTNNAFAFIDVHNEKLFYQNAEILLRMIEMLQDIHLKNDSDEHSNQFLGDMFEGFLDAGVKQSEGQFFTPMPIVKFIMNSLPLEQVIAESEHPPKAIDYACGAGHFLTELARLLKPLVSKYKKADIENYYSNITGIEKEYRLSKVAKVSAFMYGQDNINIIYNDALARNPNIEDGTYNILVANPPYSVKGFLETLTMPDKKNFQLFGMVDNKSTITNNAIEAFFIERAKQLLAPDGIAAIILPSSILSNDAKLYQQTREILLKYFHIIAIAELGSGTFGKTGTNTVTLFLKRRKAEPAEADHYKNRVSSWLHDAELNSNNKKNKLFKDLYLLEAYCTHINIAFSDYKQLWLDSAPNEALLQSEMWQEYNKSFYARTDIKNFQKKPAFKRLSEVERKAELEQMLFHHVKEIEKEKLYYFLLAHSNSVPVLVIKSPADNKAMKKFLGYEWSTAKGNEGIKYFNATPLPEPESDDEPTLVTAQLNYIQTPLYNPLQQQDEAKLNYYIQHNYLGRSFVLPDNLSEYVHTARLEDMLDFSRRDFNKTISLTPKKVGETVSKYPMVRLGDVTEVKNGATPDTNNPNYWENGTICWATLVDTKSKYLFDTAKKITQAGLDNSSAQLLPINTVIFSSRATIGEVCINKLPTATNQGYKNFVCDESKLNHEFLYYILKQFGKDIEKMISSGSKYKEINSDYIKNYKIPLPPTDVQQNIVTDCNAVDNTVNEAQQGIGYAEEAIQKIFKDAISNAEQMKFDTVATLEYGKPLKESDRRLGDIPVMGSNGIVGYHNESLIKGPSIIVGRKGSAGAIVLIENDSYPIDTTFYVKYNESKINIKYFYYLLKTLNLPEIARGKGIGVPGLNRNNVHNLKIPVPPLPVQQQLVKEIEILEVQIATAQNVIDNATAQKQVILKKWLD
ncbi:MAG: restriction endonuclease subunit S [Chitinophagaceae bacterium]